MTGVSAPTGLGEFDLGHLAFWARPEADRVAAFARLRQLDQPRFVPFINNLPLARKDDGVYALVRHADVAEASRNPKLFSSEPTANAVFDMPPWLAPFFDSMINMDGSRHSRIRKVVARAFSPRLLSKLEVDLQRRASRIVDDVVTVGRGDLVTQVAQRLPIQVICDMMGIPEHQYDYVLERTNIIIGFSDPEYTGISRDYLIRHGAPGRRHIIPVSARLLRAGLDLIRLVRRLGEERTRHPQDDLISALVNTNADGDRLAPRDVGTFFILLLVAGNETTRNVIAHAVRLFTEHPDQRALLLADYDGRIGPAIEEIVRYVTPVIQFRRTVTRDCELGGREFHRGDKLLLFYNSANRDEAVFADPDRFDITRSPNPHLGFGGPGPHYCLGANLARREITVMLRELYTRLPEIRTEGEPERLLSFFVNGIKRLPFTTGG
ncbi:MAG: methyl-branched lipid omega-hydroxylase [Pseudonocardiales bacterium]|jgi:cytochrome P450|nr:methyl-branched lipid omega-hydroxylase [Pseudonocardiales bacterium]